MNWLSRLNLTPPRKSSTRARLERWVCIACGDENPKGQTLKYCRACGLKNGYAPQSVQLKGTHSDDASLTAVEPGIALPEWSIVLPHGLPRGRSIVLRGRPGAGKSRLAYRLASQLGVTMAFGLEMGKKLSRETAANAGADMPKLFWYDELGGMEDEPYLHPACIAIDSVQKIGQGWRGTLRKLRDWSQETGGTLILVSQMNVRGSSRFSEDADFDCDIVVDVLPTIDKEKVRRTALHGFESEHTPCKDKCAHLSIAKSRICPLIAFDVPIVA
jgi:hypothetical protein